MKKILLTTVALMSLMACNDDENPELDQNQTENYSKLPQEFPFTKLTTLNGVDVINGGFGSGATAHPTRKG